MAVCSISRCAFSAATRLRLNSSTACCFSANSRAVVVDAVDQEDRIAQRAHPAKILVPLKQHAFDRDRHENARHVGDRGGIDGRQHHAAACRHADAQCDHNELLLLRQLSEQPEAEHAPGRGEQGSEDHRLARRWHPAGRRSAGTGLASRAHDRAQHEPRRNGVGRSRPESQLDHRHRRMECGQRDRHVDHVSEHRQRCCAVDCRELEIRFVQQSAHAPGTIEVRAAGLALSLSVVWILTDQTVVDCRWPAAGFCLARLRISARALIGRLRSQPERACALSCGSGNHAAG